MEGPLGAQDTVENYMTAYEPTEKGCALVAEYVAQVREILGIDIPLAFDHFGHLGINSLIKLGKALQEYNPAWLEDMVPWYRAEEWKTIMDALDVPTLTGEDVYLVESFEKFCQARTPRSHPSDPAMATSGCCGTGRPIARHPISSVEGPARSWEIGQSAFPVASARSWSAWSNAFVLAASRRLIRPADARPWARLVPWPNFLPTG
jgi:hypothetical protein